MNLKTYKFLNDIRDKVRENPELYPEVLKSAAHGWTEFKRGYNEIAGKFDVDVKRLKIKNHKRL